MVTGDAASWGVRLVRATAAYTGHSLRVTPGDQFSLQLGGLTLTEPGAASLYLASTAAAAPSCPSLQLWWPAAAAAGLQAAVLQWLVSAGGDTRHAVLGCSAPTVPGHAYREANPGTVAASKAALLARLRALNTTLADCTYLVGERLSLADLALAIVLVPAFNKVCFKYYFI